MSSRHPSIAWPRAGSRLSKGRFHVCEQNKAASRGCGHCDPVMSASTGRTSCTLLMRVYWAARTFIHCMNSMLSCGNDTACRQFQALRDVAGGIYDSQGFQHRQRMHGASTAHCGVAHQRLALHELRHLDVLHDKTARTSAAAEAPGVTETCTMNTPTTAFYSPCPRRAC